MLAAAFLALLVSAAATLAVPLAVRRMIDLGFSGIEPDLIDTYFATLAGIGFILALASAARFYCVNWLGERVVADIRADVFKHLTGLSPAFYEVSHSGEVMSRLTADTTQIKAAASTVISQALRNILVLIGASVMMAVTSPKLSLAVLIAIPVIMLPLVAYGRSVRALSRQAQDTLAQASAYASESLGQVRVLQAFTHERAASARFGKAVERSFAAANARATRNSSSLARWLICVCRKSLRNGIISFNFVDCGAERMGLRSYGLISKTSNWTIRSLLTELCLIKSISHFRIALFKSIDSFCSLE